MDITILDAAYSSSLVGAPHPLSVGTECTPNAVSVRRSSSSGDHNHRGLLHAPQIQWEEDTALRLPPQDSMV